MVLLAAVLALNAVVFAVRLTSVIHSYRLFITEGAEGPHVYAIWRAVHGYPLYEWPDQPFFTLTFYNFLFYRTYAVVLRVLGTDGEGILFGGRLITLAFALGGCFAYRGLLLDLANGGRGDAYTRAYASLLAPVLWLGTNFTAWWALSIRPDVPAVALATMGLWVLVRALRSNRLAPVALASAAFGLAWTFKQSTVLTFGAATLYLVALRRDLLRAALLASPFAILAAATLLLGGPAFRYNVITAPALSGFSWTQAAAIAGRVALQNAYVWVFPVLGWWWLRRERPVEQPGARRDDVEALLPVVALVALLAGLVALGREGSNKNHLLEGYLVTGLVASRTLFALRARAGSPSAQRGAVAAAALLVPMIVFPALQLALPNRFGVTRLATAEMRAAKRELARRVDALPKPAVVLDDVLAQPWHSSGGRYPAVVLDNVWFDIAARRGMLRHGGPETLLTRGLARSALVPAGGPYYRAAQAAGWSCEPLQGSRAWESVDDLAVCLSEGSADQRVNSPSASAQRSREWGLSGRP